MCRQFIHLVVATAGWGMLMEAQGLIDTPALRQRCAAVNIAPLNPYLAGVALAAVLVAVEALAPTT